ncbi:thiol-disulfide oxidoreductase DCC family protein [Aquirufa nivalisilvae]
MKIPVFIDGNCRFCRFCAKILRRMCGDKIQIEYQGSLLFQSSVAKYPHSNWEIDSIKVLYGEKVWIKSQAVKVVLQLAPWYYQILRVFFILPDKLLDKGYDFIAKNRLIWGKSVDECEINDFAK